MQHAEQQTAKQTRFAPGTAGFEAQKKLAVKKLLQDTFGILARAPHSWATDQSYFFTRRSEQGFGHGYNSSPEFLAALFGSAYIDMIYPKWWGGQGRVSDVATVEKVSEKKFEPGTNCAHEIYSKRDFLQSTRQPGGEESGDPRREARQPEQPGKPGKPSSQPPRAEPGLLPVAGKATVQPQHLRTQRAFDPSSFYGQNSGFGRWRIEADPRATLRDTHDTQRLPQPPGNPPAGLRTEKEKSHGGEAGYVWGLPPRETPEPRPPGGFGHKARPENREPEKHAPNSRQPGAGGPGVAPDRARPDFGGREAVGAFEGPGSLPGPQERNVRDPRDEELEFDSVIPGGGLPTDQPLNQSKGAHRGERPPGDRQGSAAGPGADGFEHGDRGKRPAPKTGGPGSQPLTAANRAISSKILANLDHHQRKVAQTNRPAANKWKQSGNPKNQSHLDTK